MKDEKIVNKLIELGYEPFKYDAVPEEVKDYNKYCVYYPHSLINKDQSILTEILEFVFVDEKDDFDAPAIINALEAINLSFREGDYGRLRKVQGGDIVNSLNLRFSRPKKKKECF